MGWHARGRRLEAELATGWALRRRRAWRPPRRASRPGLRLADGSPVLKVETPGTVVQFILTPGRGFDTGDGVLAQHDLLRDPGPFLGRLREARAAAVGAPSRRGGGRGAENC